MAWAVTGSEVVNNDSTAGSSYSLWGSLITAVDSIVVVIIATDNRTTTDGNTNDHQSLATTGSEVTWSKAYEFTNGQGGAASGACVSVWWSTPCPDLSLGSTSVTFSGSITKKAYCVRRFTTSAGATVSSVGTPQTLPNDGEDPGEMTLGSLPSAEHLWVRGIAAETNSDNSVTATGGGWVAMGGGSFGSTTGGGSAANMAVGGEYLIATATTATSNPTWVSADCASVLVALDEASATPASLPHLPFTQTSSLYQR